MAGLFLAILSMSLTGSAVILAVLLARACLRRAPKKVSYLLWIPVAFRLICPVSFASPLSLFRLPVLDAASEVSHLSAALSENIDSYDDWADDSPKEPSGPADFAAPSSAPETAGPVGMPDEPISAPLSGEHALPISNDERPASAPVNGDPAPVLPAEDPSEPSPRNELPDAGPATTNSGIVTEIPSVPQSIPSGNDGTPAEDAVSVSSPPEPSDGNAEETSALPLPDSSEESMTFLDHITGIWTRILTPLSFVWLGGIAVVLLYGVVSTLAIRRMMATAVWREDNVWESDRMRSPFILGLIRPKIYIPFGLEGDCRRYVLAHERYHLRRRDDLAKAAGWGILALHWFNPLVWLAYLLMSRDMEMRCDEAVLSGEAGSAKAYSMSLLSFAADGQMRNPLSPAFGESDVESRIRRILDWKRPKTRVTVLAGVLVLAVILVCASDPMRERPTSDAEPQTHADMSEEPDGPDGTNEDENIPGSAAFVPLSDLPDGVWTPLDAATEDVLYTTGAWTKGSLSSYVGGMWNGWYRSDDRAEGAFCSASLQLTPYTKNAFRWTGSSDWTGSAEEDSYDYRGTYRIGEDGLLTARFGAGTEEDKPYEAVFRIRYDAAHAYGTKYREVLGVTLVSSTVSGFDPWIGRELPMTGAYWFRGDLDGDPADAIRKMAPSDGAAAFYRDAAAYEFSADRLGYGEALTALYPSSYDENGNARSDPEAGPSPGRAAVNLSDLADLCLYAENTDRLEGSDSDRFRLTAFRWRGAVYELERPLYFGPYWFALSRADDFAFFTVWAPSGQGADVTYVFLTEDGAYCFDTAEAGAGYQLRLWVTDGEETVRYLRTNADFLNLQTYEETLRFRGREDDLYSESGSLRYDGDGRFVFAPEERLTGSEWFDAQKKTYPTSYPEETFGNMTFREYLSDFLPREIRDNTLRAKGLFTPEEAEEIARNIVTRMMPKAALDKGYPLNDRIAKSFLSLCGVMARSETFPDSLRRLWNNGEDGWEGMPRANAYRIASEMFGVLPDDPIELEDYLFRYDAENDRYVVVPTGLSHGYFDCEDMSTVWDEISVTVRFRLVSYVHDPADGPEPVGLAGERIDYGEYRLIFSKTSGLYSGELPRIRLAKRGEIEAEDAPEPPVSDEGKAAIVYPDFFDEEQRDLYARALALLPAVWGPSGSYIEDAFSRKDGEPFVSGYACPTVTIYDPESGYDYHYHICRGRYENWADLDAAGRALFTADLWESLTGPGKKCAEYGGKTCVLDADAGSGGHAISLDRFELVEKTDERIVYRYTTFYLARGTFEIESAERVTVTMVKTAEGWRFASFRNGNWEPAGETEVERLYLHINTPEQGESLVRLLVRGVMDDSWLAGRTSYTQADALYLAQGLKTAFTDAAFPFREATLSPDGMTWRIHADHIRNAARELFGIRDFDYYAAVRELYGEDADLSVSMDEMGFLSFPTGIGDRTTKFDVSEVCSYEEDGIVRVFAHIVNASDYPWDEADYGTYCFTFAPDFDEPGLTVEKKELPSDPLSVRLRGLTAEDILYLTSTFDQITAEELAPILNRTGLRGGQPAPEDFRSYYTLDVYLSELPSGGFGSGSETLTLFAGLEEDLVRILWSGKGTNEAEEHFVRDAALYRILRENYRLTEQIDEEALALWGPTVQSRAQETAENAIGMNGEKAYTGWQIVRFAEADSFEENGAQYTVWSWAPAYLTDDPENVVWAGGMFLDADGRVCGAETETYYARMSWPSGDVTLFFDWTLYQGPDEETGKLRGREKIVRGFAEMLENLPDGPVDEVFADPEPAFEPYSYEIATALQRKEEHGNFLIDVDIKEIHTDSPHEAHINKVIRDDFTELYNGYMEQLERFPYDFFRLKIVTEFCERDGILCVTVRAELPKTYLGPDRIANIFYNIRTDSLLTREEFAAREGIDLSSVLRELEALYPQGSDGSPFSYEIVGLRTRAAGEIGFYVDRIYRMDGEVEARETLFYRADAGTLMPSENPDTDYLVLPYFGQEQTAWDASDPFRITIFVQNAGRRSWPMDQSFYAEDESDPVGWVTFSAVWDLGAFGGDFAKMASAVLPSWQKGHTAAVGEPEFVAGSEDDALFRFRTFSIPNQVLSPEAPEEEENWCYIRRAVRSGQLRNGDPVILTFAGRNPRLPGTDEGFLEALRSKTDTSFLAGRVYVAGTVSNSARNLSELSAYGSISPIEFAEAFAEGDAEALDAMRYREDGSYSETGLPEVVFVMYEMERLCPSGCRIVMKAEFSEGNGMFSPGIHTFELLSSLDQPLIREISGGEFRLADIGRRDDKAWLRGGEFPEAERALAAFLWLESYDAQPGYTPLGAMEFFTRFFTVQSETADGDEIVFTVRFWHDASMLVPSELREYRFRKGDGGGYVLSGNRLIEETEWAPGGWMV